jgi:hypothetical protein
MKKALQSSSAFALFMQAVGELRRTVICALLVITFIGCASVRNEPRSQISLDVQVDFALGVTTVKQEPPDDWYGKFEPASENVLDDQPGDIDFQYSGDMNVRDPQLGTSLAFGLQPEFRQYAGAGWRVGALARYQLYYPGGIDQRMSVTKVEWWNVVTLQTISLRRTPALGMLVIADAPKHQQFRLHATAFYYSLARLDYRGVDRYGDVNYSVVDDRTVLRCGLGFGLGFDFRPPWTDEDLGRFGVFLDEAETSFSLGFGWRYTIPMHESGERAETSD